MFSGITTIDPTVRFSFDDNLLTLNIGSSLFEIPNRNFIIGQTDDGQKKYYFRVPGDTFAKDTDYERLLGNITTSVIYYIDGFNSNCVYNSIVFMFPIIDFFLKGTLIRLKDYSSLKLRENDKSVAGEYPFEFRGGDMLLRIFLPKNKNFFSYNNVPFGQIEISSNEPFTPDLAYQLSQYICGLFSFLYNRSDVSIGTVLMQSVVEKKVISQSSLRLTEQITHEVDNNIPNFLKGGCPFFYYYKQHLGELIRMCFKDDVLFSHLSEAEKRTYDLKRILFLNFDFEYYYQHLIVDNNKNARVTTREKDRNKTLDLSELTLVNKLIFAFNPNLLIGRMQRNGINIIGVSDVNWEGVDKILDYYADNSFREELVTTFKKWRDAEAHAKDFNLSKNFPNLIESIRFVECLNYCIVLKQAGYSIKEIRSIVYNFFFDPRTLFYDYLVRVCQSKLKDLCFDNNDRLSLIWQSNTDSIIDLFNGWHNRLLKQLSIDSIEQSNDIQPYKIMFVNDYFTYNIVRF